MLFQIPFCRSLIKSMNPILVCPFLCHRKYVSSETNPSHSFWFWSFAFCLQLQALRHKGKQTPDLRPPPQPNHPTTQPPNSRFISVVQEHHLDKTEVAMVIVVTVVKVIVVCIGCFGLFGAGLGIWLGRLCRWCSGWLAESAGCFRSIVSFSRIHSHQFRMRLGSHGV